MLAIKLMGYKADGLAHRLWQRLYLVEEREDLYIFASSYPSITETNGRAWSNAEPTLYLCSKKHFFNVIVRFKSDGRIVYYVNIASPTMPIGPGQYGFIDLDLDVKLLEDKSIKVLDEEEFIENSKRYKYSEELIKVARLSTSDVVNKMKNGDELFDDQKNHQLMNEFLHHRNDQKIGV